MARQVQASQAGLHDYIGAITSAQEEERLRLARELHDDTIQELIALKQRLQLARKASREPDTAPMLAELERLTEVTIDNVRRMTRALRPIYLEDLGLMTALEMLTRETNQVDGLRVDFQKHGPGTTPEPRNRIGALPHCAAGPWQCRAPCRGTQRRPQVWISLTRRSAWRSATTGSASRYRATPRTSPRTGISDCSECTNAADLIGARLEVHSEPGHGTQHRSAPASGEVRRRRAGRLAHPAQAIPPLRSRILSNHNCLEDRRSSTLVPKDAACNARRDDDNERQLNMTHEER